MSNPFTERKKHLANAVEFQLTYRTYENALYICFYRSSYIVKQDAEELAHCGNAEPKPATLAT
jgi:hypothetical protein